MKVTKRNGQLEEVNINKVIKRIKLLCKGLNTEYVKAQDVALKTLGGLFEGVKTTELDELAAETAATMATVHPDYTILASRISVSNLHKETKNRFSDVMADLYHYINPKTNEHAGMISEEVYQVIQDNKERLDNEVNYERDYDYDYFGFKTLERAYLLRINNKIAERPQQMIMRVSIGIHGMDIESAIKTYHLMSEGWFTHATPTLFNSGTPKPQMSSCFLMQIQEDSIDGIYDTLKQTARISQTAGGIGLSIHDVRAKGSYITGTNGYSNGIVPMLRVFNDTARYIDQCFTPKTLVFSERGVKRIKDIVVGDKLLSHNGKYNTVNRCLNHSYKGEVLKIAVKNSIEEVKVTPKHLFLVIRNQERMMKHSVIKNRLDKNLLKIEWIEASELTTNDFIAFPVAKDFKDYDNYSLEDCRFYGMMVGDGYISKNNKQANITLNAKSADLEFVTSYLNARSIRYSTTADESKVRYTWSASASFKFNRELLYDANSEKIIHHSLLNLPKEKALQIVKGVIETDGCISNRDNYEITLEMTSFNVVESVRFILMKLGILSSGGIRDRIGNVSSYKNITTRKKTKVLRIPKDEAVTELFSLPKGTFFTYLNHNGYSFSRVTSIQEEKYEGVVHDFEVEDAHSYTTTIGISHNGGGKRKGSFSIYLEPWHADVFDFLELKKNHGKEEARARDLFYALWINDLFMKRVEEDGQWSLFCPNEARGLSDCHGQEFEELYTRYESEGKARKTIKAQELWFAILESQIETGTPYMLYKDHANKKSNQQNLGTIKSSNLCTEIIEYTAPDEVAVCNLASLALPKFVSDNGEGLEFNHHKLYKVTYQATVNLNRIIDRNYYPVKEAENSNLRHRPIGLGVQGLADVFMLLRLPFESKEAQQLNKEIFETIYYASMTASNDLAIGEGAYSTFEGSPLSKGLFQFNLWNVEENSHSGRWNWNTLRESVVKHGVRNSLLVAPMPTASTSQILGNNECFEPYTSNIYVRRVLSGEFVMVNKHLLKDLIALDLWDDTMKNNLIAANGSVQDIPTIPQELKDIYKTVWEISQKTIIDMSAARGVYICQSQSLNIHIQNPTFGKLTSMHFHAWKSGLKTGMYYLRTKAAADAIKFTVDKDLINSTPKQEETGGMCSMDDDCLSCGS